MILKQYILNDVTVEFIINQKYHLDELSLTSLINCFLTFNI